MRPYPGARLVFLVVVVALLMPVVAARAVQIDSGDILLATQYAVVWVDPVTGQAIVVSSGGALAEPLGVVVEPNGDLLVADRGSKGVIRVDPLTGQQHVISVRGFFSNPRALAIAPDGQLLVADERAQSGKGEVIRVNPVTGAQAIVSSGGLFVNLVGIVVGPNGDILVVDQNAMGGSGAVIKIDPVTGEQTVVSSGGGFLEPFGIAVAPNGDIFVSDPDAAAVFRVNPITGGQTTVSSGGALVGETRGIAVALNGDLLVAHRSRGVIRIDPADGGQTMVSSQPGVGIAVAELLDVVGDVVVAGEPVVGAKVTLRATIGGRTRTQTDAIGRYTFDLVADGTYRLMVRALEVFDGARVSGNLTVRGRPSADKLVKLINLRTRERATTTTDAGGDFAFQGVAGGEYKLVISGVTVP